MLKYTKEDLAFIKNDKALQKTSNISMEHKICLITGATSGVGLETVKILAKAGATIIFVARNQAKAEALRNSLFNNYSVEAKYYIADFGSFEDVRTVATLITLNYPSIDVLINSVGMYSTKKLSSNDGNELVFQVNHLSAFLFTKLLLGSIGKSDQGRIIQVNSEGHRFGGLRLDDLKWDKRHYIGLRAYGASKTAQLMTVIELSKHLAGTKITINAMHPGAVKTNIGSNNGWLYRTWNKYMLTPTLKDPKISGEALYYLASAPELSGVSGKFFNLTIEEKPMPHVLIPEVGEKIWILSHELTGLDLPQEWIS